MIFSFLCTRQSYTCKNKSQTCVLHSYTLDYNIKTFMCKEIPKFQHLYYFKEKTSLVSRRLLFKDFPDIFASLHVYETCSPGLRWQNGQLRGLHGLTWPRMHLKENFIYLLNCKLCIYIAWKTVNILQCHRFPHEMMSEEWAQKFLTDDVSLTDLGSASDWLKQNKMLAIFTGSYLPDSCFLDHQQQQ